MQVPFEVRGGLNQSPSLGNAVSSAIRSYHLVLNSGNRLYRVGASLSSNLASMAGSFRVLMARAILTSMRALSSRALGTMVINCTSLSLWGTIFEHHLSSIPGSSYDTLQDLISIMFGFLFFSPRNSNSAPILLLSNWTGSFVHFFLSPSRLNCLSTL